MISGKAAIGQGTLAACYSGGGDSMPPVWTTHGLLARWGRSLPARQTLALLKPYRTTGTLLELGPGRGDVLLAARAAGFTVSGLEINPERARCIRERLGLPCASTPLTDSPWLGRRFDIVYHRDVLSHFYDQVAEFHRIHDVLGEDGLLIFETGNLGEVATRYLSLVPTFDYPEHLYFFGEKSLRRLLALTGFHLLTLRRYDLEVYFWLARLAKAMRSYRTAAADPAGRLPGNPKPRRPPEARRAGGQALCWLGYEFVAESLWKYQVGSWSPRRGRPQTLVVIARRI